MANLQSTSTSTREGRKQRRRMPPLCFRAGAQLAPESAALKLRSRAEKIAKALDSRCAGRGDDLRAAAWAEEDGRAEAAERAAEEGESTSGRDNPNAKAIIPLHRSTLSCFSHYLSLVCPRVSIVPLLSLSTIPSSSLLSSLSTPLLLPPCLSLSSTST